MWIPFHKSTAIFIFPHRLKTRSLETGPSLFTYRCRKRRLGRQKVCARPTTKWYSNVSGTAWEPSPLHTGQLSSSLVISILGWGWLPSFRSWWAWLLFPRVPVTACLPQLPSQSTAPLWMALLAFTDSSLHHLLLDFFRKFQHSAVPELCRVLFPC